MPPIDGAVIEALTGACREGRLVVFAGAGVSAAPPTEAPLFRPMRRDMLNALLTTLEGALPEEIRGQAGRSFEPGARSGRTVEPAPEVLFQALRTGLGDRLFAALRTQLATGDYNMQHAFFAGLLASGALELLVTTNFDNCFESAVAETGAPLRVCADGAGMRASLEAVLDRRRKDGERLIWKPHGDLAEGREETLRVTLTDAALGRAEADKVHSLGRVFRERPVLVVGYSGHDHDIAPVLIEAAKEGVALYWLALDTPQPDAPAAKILSAWGGKGRLLTGDLWDLCAELARAWRWPWAGARPAPSGSAATAARRRALVETLAGATTLERLMALGFLMHALDETRLATTVLEVADALAESAGRAFERGVVAAALAEIKIKIGRPQEARPYAARLAALGETLDNPGWTNWAKRLDQRLSAESALAAADLDAARAKLSGLIAGLDPADDDEETAMAFHQSLAIAQARLGDWGAAEREIAVVRRLAEKLGERNAALSADYELAVIAYEAGRHAEARAAFEQVLDEARVIGDRRIEAAALYETAILLAALDKDLDGAKARLEQALAIAEAMNSEGLARRARFKLADIVSDQGEATRDRGKLAEAGMLFSECLAEAQAAGDAESAAFAVTRRARMRAYLGDWAGCEADLDAADEFVARHSLFRLRPEIDGLRRAAQRARE